MRRFGLAPFAALVLLGCGGDGAAGGLAAAERRYIGAAVPHHHLGMELVNIAGPRAYDVRFRRLVFVQGQYHGKEIYQLETWGERWSVVPAGRGFPGDLGDSVLATLRSTTGAAFDVAWLEAMIEHHEGYLVIADQAVAAGRTPVVGDFAGRTAKGQREQIAEMEALLAELRAEQ